MFEAINITGSGMHAHQEWLSAISDNVANVNTVRRTSESAFRTRYINVKSIEDGGVGAGVAVEDVKLSDGEGRLVYAPEHPLADKNGMVRYPDVDIAEQLTTMIAAQRGYQANIAAFDRVRSSYQAAIQMGRS